MDNFHGGKVTLSLQRNYREARGKENLGSSIYDPRNAKILSDRRNSHATEQHDYSTRMHNGFRAKGATSRNQPSHKRKNSEYLKQTIAIGSTLTEEGRKELCSLLRRNLDIFAWKPVDMTRVPRHIAEHRLYIREGCLSVKQNKKGQAPERNKAIYEEVEKLMDAGIMKEVHYHSWLSNTVMMKKHDGSWRMCMDFKDLNKACPKAGYPLPKIGWKVESLCEHPFKCFMDAYKGYHQIKIAKEDEEKTTFITSQGIFCYSKMPEINMKLNPKKCTFGIREGMFIGYKVNADGLRVCSDKVEAVLSLPSLKCLKDKKRLNGKLVSLNRFLSKSAKKSLPFFKTLTKCTKKSDFQWTAKAKMAFKQMKTLIAELPMLTAPKKRRIGHLPGHR
nr:reverse transcriptase domain-containing protein [Tanacetum cinerariifolium]